MGRFDCTRILGDNMFVHIPDRRLHDCAHFEWSSSKIVFGSRALPPRRLPHSAVALLLKAALIQVSDYRLLGASG
jgi:hypothetical protein